ncbi:MAG TPA: hypothetical protein ENI07_17240 [Desulfobacterales bacterium]|nr:hypothetical protein [Desulfobacterales bacterium]
MIKRSDDALQGMKEICAYANRSESTIIDWKLKRGFPASKIGGGIWESSKTAIDKWKQGQVEKDDPEKQAISKKKKKR